jgi:arsenate reductase
MFFESYSAGTEIKDCINPDAVRLVKLIYGIDMELTQRPKLLAELPEKIDIAVKMGCNVVCPYLPAKQVDDWELDDPTGKPDEEFIKAIRIIENKIQQLRACLLNKK